MWKQGKKFEHEVHLGFLVIVFVLLLLNVVANFVVYRARASQHEKWSSQFSSAARMVTRQVEQQWPAPLSSDQSERLTDQFSMTRLLVVRSQPPGDSLMARQAWFISIIEQLPKEQLPQFVEQLLLSQYSAVTRGERNEYFYVHPVAGKGVLVVLSANIPEMAYLDDSARVLLYCGLGAMVLVSLMYLVLSRYIFSPFRRIKAVAQNAGRPVANVGDEAEALVSEYKSIIAELKRNEGELRRLNNEVTRRADSLEHLHRHTLRSMQAGLLTLDTAGTVVEINEFASRMLGATETVIGKHYTELFSELAGLVESIAVALRTGIVGGYHEFSVGMAGTYRTTTWGVTLSLIRDQDNRVIGLSIWMAEVTELVRLRLEVESKNRLAALGEMASGLAHQLRNSLGAISGYGTLIKRRLVKAEQPFEPAESLLEESRQAESLISRFLTFARPFDYTPAPVEVDDLVNQIVDSSRIREDFGQIDLQTKLQSGATIVADSLLLKQAVSNIVDNAANAYGDRVGVIRVSTSLANETVSVEIADDGEGIPPDRLNRIFTPFYSSRPSGTGLGLPLVRKIIDLHGGHIAVDSEVGRGTKFTLTFSVNSTDSSRLHAAGTAR